MTGYFEMGFPEPVLSKALAGAVTLALLLTYSAAELYSVGLACLKLYREAEAAGTGEELEAVAERFGKALGGVGLRVLVTVAGAKLARGLPEVPRGGLWGKLSPPRFAMAGGGGRGGFTVGACAESKQDGHQRHHLGTNKNETSEITGGPWTPRFEELFARAGMSLEDPANIVYLRDHKGPHPEAYHSEVFERLKGVLGACRPHAECRARLLEELDRIAGDICTPGSKLNKLATRKP